MTLKEEFGTRAEKIIKIVDENETFDEVKIDCYGTDWIEISEEELEALKIGKILHIEENGGEYQMFLKLK